MGDNFFAFLPSASSSYIAIPIDDNDSFYEAIEAYVNDSGKKPIEWEKYHLNTFLPSHDGKQGSLIALSYNVKFCAFKRDGNQIFVSKAQGPTPGYSKQS